MIQKLIDNIKKTKAPIVVGLDPMLSYVPEHLQKKAFAEYGETLEGAAQAIWQFNKEIVDATWDLIPAVKPQIAMYEQFGLPGLAAFKRRWITAMRKGWWSSGISSAVISVPHRRRTRSAIWERCRWEAKRITVSTKIS